MNEQINELIDGLEYAVLARAGGLPGSAEKLSDAKQALRAALASRQVPEGWVLVPVEPTPEMRAVATRGMEEGAAGAWWDNVLVPAYRAMLAASPSSPSTGEEPKEPNHTQALTLLVNSLCSALKRAAPDHPLPKRAAEYINRFRLSSPLRSLDASPSADARALLDSIPTSWELSHGSDDEEEQPQWRVHRCHGSVNDREWTLLGVGATPSEALASAIRSKENTHG